MIFPISFNHRLLDSLPLVDLKTEARIDGILNRIVSKKLLPYFKRRKGAHAITIGKFADHLSLRRWEDPQKLINVVGKITRQGEDRILDIHECLFDYMAFLIPEDSDGTLEQATRGERRILAFTEFMLRHLMEQGLYADTTIERVVHSDIVFAMDRRRDDPTYYRSLKECLNDELNGLDGRRYLHLLDLAEQDRPLDTAVGAVSKDYRGLIARLPEGELRDFHQAFSAAFQLEILTRCYEDFLQGHQPVHERVLALNKLLYLLSGRGKGESRDTNALFAGFGKDRDLRPLWRELDLAKPPQSGSEMAKLADQRLEHFYNAAKQAGAVATQRPTFKPPPLSTRTAPPLKSLDQRIEDARNDKRVPPQVTELIDKNKSYMGGQSGSKYGELIDTLLSIPWARIHKVDVPPKDFEEGLNRSHYGLSKPKELVSDLFINLIWRYRRFKEEQAPLWRGNGMALLFVGPPGVGKTSLAISIASNLGLPYHKISLGGMRDEAELLGHGFTYQGSKPGAIVQGLIKMGAMNGMFIMDETDKAERFAIATLLEILDPEQNHMFHDKYAETTVDIDLSNCIFVLTANTLDTVAPPVLNRCEIVRLDRYTLEEKVAIARQHLIRRIQDKFEIKPSQVYFDPKQQTELLKHLIKTYTHEAGVRELERVIRSLFLRTLRKEILLKGRKSVRINRNKLKDHLDPPKAIRRINQEDRIGEIMTLGMDREKGIAFLVPIQATRIRSGAAGGHPRSGYLSAVEAVGEHPRVLEEIRNLATTAILHRAESLGIDLENADAPIHLHVMGDSSYKDKASAAGAIALALASALSEREILKDAAVIGEIDTQGRFTATSGLEAKLEAAVDAGCRMVMVPRENLYGEEGTEGLSGALQSKLQILPYEAWKAEHPPFNYRRHLLQVVGVSNIVQAVDAAFADPGQLESLNEMFVPHAAGIARRVTETFSKTRPFFQVVYMKDLKELDLRRPNDCFWQECGCVFLTTPKVKEAIEKSAPGMETPERFWELDPNGEDFVSLLRRIGEELDGGNAGKPRRSVLAPFSFFKRNGIGLKDASLEKALEGWTFFANDYASQGVELKSCKALLNRILCHLAQLETAELDECPFLRQQNGVHCLDLSFIPEKYRLDAGRTESILFNCLTGWLGAFESNL